MAESDLWTTLDGPSNSRGGAPRREAPPQPALPSRAFTWSWRAVLLIYLVGSWAVTLLGGVPADRLLSWRVAVLAVGAGVSGVGAASFWAWTARPRFTRQQQRSMQKPAPDDWKTIQRALRNRRAPLPLDLEDWARTFADMQEAATIPVAAGMGVLMGGALAQDTTESGFPTWGVYFHPGMLLWFLAILAWARWQQSSARPQAHRRRPSAPHDPPPAATQ